MTLEDNNQLISCTIKNSLANVRHSFTTIEPIKNGVDLQATQPPPPTKSFKKRPPQGLDKGLWYVEFSWVSASMVAFRIHDIVYYFLFPKLIFVTARC